MPLNPNPTVVITTRRVTLLNDPYINPLNNLLWTTGQDNRGFQYQIALDALPPNVSITQVRQGQVWFVENSSTAYRLSLFVSDSSNLDPTLLPQFPPTYGNYYDTTTQIAPLANTPYVVTFNNDAGSNGFTLVSGSRITTSATGIYIFSFSAQLALLSTGGTSTYNASIWTRVNGVDTPWSSGEVSIYAKSPFLLPSWNFIQQMNTGDYLELVWAVDTPSQIYVAAQPSSANGYAPSQPAPPYGPSVPSWTMTVSQA